MKFQLGSEITGEQQAFLETNGYLHFEAVASRAEVEGMLADLDRVEATLLAQRRRSVRGIPLFFGRRPDGTPGIQRLAFTSLFSPAVARFVRDRRFDPVRRLVADDARVGEDEKDGVVVNRFVNLPGSAFPRLGWHTDGLRDLFYLKKPGPMLNVGLHFDDCTAENGGLRLIPGTHRQSFLSMCFAKPYFVSHRADPREVCVETKAGDLTIHDGRLWHRVARSTRTGAESLRRTMYVPVLAGPREPKTEESRTPLYHRAGQLLRRIRTGAVLALMLLAPLRARAGGYWNLDQGTENFARGGAGIVAPSDPTAVYLNPSALVTLPGLQLQIGANASDDHRRFERATDWQSYAPVQNTMPIAPTPNVFASWRVTPWLAAGAGLFGPPSSDPEYSPAGAERYSIVESHNRQMQRSLSLAVAIPGAPLRVGVTGMLVKQTVDVRQDFNTFLGAPEAPGWDAQAHVYAVDRDIPTAAAGATLDLSDRWQVAASGQLGWRVHARGTITASLGDQLAQAATVKGDAVGVSFRLPPIARAGARLRDPAGAWDGELALVYEAWSQDREVDFAPSHVYLLTTAGIGLAVPTIRQPTHLRDTFSVRAGGSLSAGRGVRLRGGAFYERAAVAPQHLSPATFDLDKIGVTAGARAPLPRRAWIDVALGGQYWIPVTVRSSDVLLPDPVHRKTAWAIGNGRYSNWRVTGMVGVGIAM